MGPRTGEDTVEDMARDLIISTIGKVNMKYLGLLSIGRLRSHARSNESVYVCLCLRPEIFNVVLRKRQDRTWP